MRAGTLLYMMHVSWYWIKQRPHFLAEELSNFFNVSVACLEDYNNVGLKSLGSNQLSFFPFTIIKNKLLGNFLTSRLNFHFKQLQLYRLVRKSKYLWFTSPQQYLLCSKFISEKHIVIYDCMDDHAAFFSDETTKSNLTNLEEKLCIRANFIFTSAGVLKERLIQKYQPLAPIKVINNALIKKDYFNSTTKFDQKTKSIFQHQNRLTLTYIGTVANWFDFDLMIKMLDKYPNCQLVVVGPSDCELPQHQQITYLGKVAHELVSGIMSFSDVLVMPFVVNDLIRAVNPVKAYEYIASGKPVILTKYDETVIFEEFAYLYETEEDIDNLFLQVSQSNLSAKHSKQKCIDFANANTWELRALEINTFIK